MKKSFLLIGTGLLIGAGALQSCKNAGGSGEAVVLKMNLEPGAQYAYVMDMKMNMEQSGMNMEQVMTMESNYNVAAGEGTDKKLTVSYERIAMSMKSPMMSMEYDSKDGGKKDSMLSGMGAILHKPFTMVVSEQGEIKKIEGLNAIIEGMSATNEHEAQMKNQVSGMFSDTAVRSMMEQSLNIYPDKAVKKGDTWNKAMSINMGPMRLKMDNTYKLASVSNGIAHLDMTSKITSDGGTMAAGGKDIKIDLSGDSKGTLDVAVATGLVTAAAMKQNIKGTVNAMGMQMPMNMVSDIHITGKKK